MIQALLIVILLLPEGGYKEFVSTAMSMEVCAEALPKITEQAKETGLRFTAACTPVVGGPES